MLSSIQATVLLSLASYAAAASCNQTEPTPNSNENLANVTDINYAQTADILSNSSGLDASGVVGSRIFGNLSLLQNISAFCSNAFNGTRSLATTLGGTYGAESRNGQWHGDWQWSTLNGSWSMNVTGLGQEVNVSQSLVIGLDGSVTFELDAQDLSCEQQQPSGKWICKGGNVCTQ